MTNEQAIKVLLDEWKCIDRNDGINCDRQCEKCDLVMDSAILKDAYNMAIQALSQEPCRYWQNGKCNGNTEVCDDAISRDAALDEIDDTNRRGGFGCKLSYTRCRGHIKQLPPVTHKSGKWINVNDMLPREREDVLVTCFVHENWQTKIGYWNGKAWVVNAYDILFIDRLEVTAWMPLPKPYEPQESEDKG